jgi:hypothetical protein
MPAPPALQRLAEQSGLGSASAAQLLLVALASLALARLLARFLSNYLRRIAPPPAAMAEPAPEPVMCGELTLEQLRAFDGSDPSKPLYLVRARACVGQGHGCVLRAAAGVAAPRGVRCAARRGALGSGLLVRALRAHAAPPRRVGRRAWATSTT